MKKTITFMLAGLVGLSSYATHLMGGQITASYLGSDSTGIHYAIDFTAYRDTIGIPISASATFYISQLDTSGSWNSLFSSTVSFDTTSGNLMPTMTVYGVEVYTYVDTITLPGNGHYSISWSDCCRNVAIVNMSNPGGESLALETYITVDSVDINSSPYYMTPPVAYLPADTLWQYNPLPFDPDGDSLAWTMVTPLTSGGLVSGYQFLSDTSLYSNITGVFALDSITGALSWDASMVGNFVASFEISEWRNGVYMGKMRRDMQFIVVPDSVNAMPQISNMQSLPTNNMGYPYVKIAPGVDYNVSLLASDPDVNDIVSLEAYGEPFEFINSPASFYYILTGNGNEIEGTFSWNPDVSQVSSTPYLVVFRTSDNFFSYDETVQIEVALATEVENISESLTANDLYPNPASNSFALSLGLENAQMITLDIYNMLGVKVSSEALDLKAGNHIIVKNFDLNTGNYFVNIANNNGVTISTKKLIVIK